MSTRLRHKLATRARTFIPEGDEVQAAFVGTIFSPTWLLVGIVPYFIFISQFSDSSSLSEAILRGAAFGAVLAAVWLSINRSRIVIVTDQRILLLRAKWLATHTPAGVLREFSRSTRLSTTGRKVEALDRPLWIQPQLRSELKAADDALPN